ncbi:MAG: LytTR family DNA-binding domain-containing protein [Cyclobacteriaceae bacterium]
MKVAIIEDEERAANRLKQLLKETDPELEVAAEMETIREVLAFDWQASSVRLIFLDIHLADGSSFEIFKELSIELPIIFTTAYDQYALEAFQVNSLDYLLKPIDKDKLSKALDKWKKWYAKPNEVIQPGLEKLLAALNIKKEYTKNLLVQQKHRLVPVEIGDFALFMIENGIVRGITFDEQLYYPDQNMDELEAILNPQLFYRASRQIILNRRSIAGIESYFNSRLLVTTKPGIKDEILVSKAKAREFKSWVKGEKID